MIKSDHTLNVLVPLFIVIVLTVPVLLHPLYLLFSCL
nr:MAG TPA: hypothetical protein [Bacteriophage sp.]